MEALQAAVYARVNANDCYKSHFDKLLQQISPGATMVVQLTPVDMGLLLSGLSACGWSAFTCYEKCLKELRKDIRNDKLCAAVRESTAANFSAYTAVHAKAYEQINSPTKAASAENVVYGDTGTCDDMPELVPAMIVGEQPLTEHQKTINAWIDANPGKILKWCEKHQEDFDEYALCTYMAVKGSLELLGTADLAGYPMKDDLYVWALENGHTDVARWLINSGHANANDVMSIAATYGYLNLVKFCTESAGQIEQPTHVCIQAAANGHLEVIQWVAIRPVAVDWAEVLKTAEMNKCWDIINWIESMGLVD